jgi:glycogen operon protein
MSQTRNAEHGIVGEDVLSADPQQSDQLSKAPGAAVGRSAPVGATVSCDGVNFSLYARDASGIELMLFDHEDDMQPSRVIRLNPSINRTYHYWHVFVPGLQTGQLYGYRVQGPFDPCRGLRFDPTKLLLDPYGRGVAVPRNYSREAARTEGDNVATAMKSVIVDPSSYDWNGDTPLRRPSSQTIVYEMHVKGLRGIRAPAYRKLRAALSAGSLRRFPISRT